MKHLHGMQVFDLIVDLIYDFFRSFKQLNFSSYLLRYSYWAVYDSIVADCQHLQSVHDVPHHYKLVSTRQGFKDPDRIILWSTDALSRYLIAREQRLATAASRQLHCEVLLKTFLRVNKNYRRYKSETSQNWKKFAEYLRFHIINLMEMIWLLRVYRIF